ncbi:MAG: hypothetical protein ACP5T3_00925 [Candidatus Micrarchaeia archaeon]
MKKTFHRGSGRFARISKLQAAELFLLFLFFIAGDSAEYLYAFLSGTEYLIFAAFSALFIAFAYALAVGNRNDRDLSLLFVAALALFAFTIYASGAPKAIAANVAILTEMLSIALLILIPAMFLISIGAYFYAENKPMAMALLGIALILLLLYYASNLIFKGIGMNDEMFIAVKSARMLMQGVNPYGISFSKQIFYNASKFEPTVSVKNTILGTLQYPPLFLLSFMPFYLVAFEFHGSETASFLITFTAYLFVMLLALFFTREREDRLRPSLALFCIVAAAIAFISAVQDLLMVALLIIAYEKINSKYAWAFLGLGIAMQELLWVPILFLVVYLALNRGMRHALKQLALAALLFAAISSWFIATKPVAFLSSILLPLSGPMPSATSPFGFAILKGYGITLGAYLILFVAVLVVSSLLLAFHNKKQLIPVFSMLPFLFLDHSIITYYTTFGMLLAFALFFGKDEKPNMHAALARFSSKNRKVLLAAIAVVAVVCALALAASHAAYERSFNVSLSNETMNNTIAQNGSVITSASALLHYRNLPNGTAYMYFVEQRVNASAADIGLINNTVINSNVKSACNSYACKINTNVLKLQGSGTYTLEFKTSSNETVTCIAPIIYNGEYWAFPKPVCG